MTFAGHCMMNIVNAYQKECNLNKEQKEQVQNILSNKMSILNQLQEDFEYYLTGLIKKINDPGIFETRINQLTGIHSYSEFCRDRASSEILNLLGLKK